MPAVTKRSDFSSWKTLIRRTAPLAAFARSSINSPGLPARLECTNESTTSVASAAVVSSRGVRTDAENGGRADDICPLSAASHC